MTLRIADLCLGTDKDWKVGKTKIFLKVRCWEALTASGLLGTAGGGGKSPSQSCLLWSPAGLWVPLVIDSCTGLPHSGHLGSKQEGGNRETAQQREFPKGTAQKDGVAMKGHTEERRMEVVLGKGWKEKVQPYIPGSLGPCSRSCPALCPKLTRAHEKLSPVDDR